MAPRMLSVVYTKEHRIVGDSFPYYISLTCHSDDSNVANSSTKLVPGHTLIAAFERRWRCRVDNDGSGTSFVLKQDAILRPIDV